MHHEPPSLSWRRHAHREYTPSSFSRSHWIIAPCWLSQALTVPPIHHGQLRTGKLSFGDDGRFAKCAGLHLPGGGDKQSKQLVTVEHLVKAHWAEYGRNFYQRYDYEVRPPPLSFPGSASVCHRLSQGQVNAHAIYLMRVDRPIFCCLLPGGILQA